ncbi:hypothetical protein AB4Z22_05745, partial [Paenibacillus sp. TAF58]
AGVGTGVGAGVGAGVDVGVVPAVGFDWKLASVLTTLLALTPSALRCEAQVVAAFNIGQFPLAPTFIDKNNLSSKYSFHSFKSEQNLHTPHIDNKLDSKKAPVQFKPKYGAFRRGKRGRKGTPKTILTLQSLLIAQRIKHLHRLAAGHPAQG